MEVNFLPIEDIIGQFKPHGHESAFSCPLWLGKFGTPMCFDPSLTVLFTIWSTRSTLNLLKLYKLRPHLTAFNADVTSEV